MGQPRPGKMDLTLVAHYGDKPPELQSAIQDLWSELGQCLPRVFKPYSIKQVHGTIIGLEGERVGSHVVNTNYLNLRKQRKPVSLTGVLDLLRAGDFFPTTIEIGGYTDGAAYPIVSRGQTPYMRSFGIQGKTAIAMGWPRKGDRYPLVLDRLRWRMNDANILHKYHAAPGAIDNDFFFVLGVLQKEISVEMLQRTQDRMREFLATRGPFGVALDWDTVSIVGYIDPQLPTKTSCCYSLGVAADKIDEILGLYREVVL